MQFADGTTHWINWLANVICPCLGVLFFCAAIYCYGQSHMRLTHYWYAGWTAFLLPGIVRLFEAFTNQVGASNPDSYYLAIRSTCNWLANVILPMNAVLQLMKAVGAWSGIFERGGRIRVWGPVHHITAALLSLSISGLIRLVLYLINLRPNGVS
jgi:hypothetical protein